MVRRRFQEGDIVRIKGSDTIGIIKCFSTGGWVPYLVRVIFDDGRPSWVNNRDLVLVKNRVVRLCDNIMVKETGTIQW